MLPAGSIMVILLGSDLTPDFSVNGRLVSFYVHLIPRRAGDLESPRGGVCHVILGKRHY